MPVAALGPEEIMTTDPGDTLANVAKRLKEENVGCLVVTENDEPVGVITDRDIALAVGDGHSVSDTHVRDVMTENPVTLHEDEEAMAISRTIGEAHVRRIPVVNDDGKITGIVTLDDLVATIGEQLGNVADTIETQSPQYRP